MIKALPVLGLLLLTWSTHAQQKELVASAGESKKVSGYVVDFAIGEVITGGNESGAFHVSNGVIPQASFTPTAITPKPTLQLNAFPNPVVDYLTITGLEADVDASVLVYDKSGRLIEKATLKNNRFNMTNYPFGEYIIVVEDNQQKYTTKILKK